MMDDLMTAHRPWWRRVAKAIGPIAALLLVWVGFGLAVAWKIHADDPDAWMWRFFSRMNQSSILTQTAVVAVAACGMTMIIISGGIDLAAGSTIALCSVVAARVLEAEWSPAAALAAALIGGGAVGPLSGGVIAGLGIVPFIVTLGMMSVARGASKLLADNQSVNFPTTWLNVVMQPVPGRLAPAWQQALVVAPGVWVAAALAVITTVIMRATVFGRQCYAIGSNEAAARLCGVRVRSTKLMIYALAGGYFAIAGMLQTAKLRQGDPTTAIGLELDVIAAVVIGGASLSGGAGGVMGAMIGALIMAVLRNGTQQIGWSTAVQEVIIGVVIVLAAGVDRWRQRRTRG